jgi:hypothetical protein
MLMRMMDDIGRDKLFKAVDIANDAGNPTLEKVRQLLFLEAKAVMNADEVNDADVLDYALLEDDFYVERGNPSDYDALWYGRK